MRIHRILAEACAGLLKSVFRDRRVLEQELAQAFQQNPKWGKRDRSFIAETVYEVARWRRSLAFVADCEEITALCAAQWQRNGFDLPSWWSHKGCSPGEMDDRQRELGGQPRALRESIPDWLDQWGSEDLGEEAWSLELAALNKRARVGLRVNTLRCSRDEALAWLAQHGVSAEPVDAVDNALILPEGHALPKSLRADGRVEIQDAGSQCIVPLLEARPGERVIDACSGAGGKALQIAAMMGNEGRIYAMDVDAGKLSELGRRARRAGAKCIVTKPINETTPADFEHVADRLLIDAPCSGLGTLKRQPDLKWRLRPAAIERVREIQVNLLSEYSKMLRPGGRLVYATCSILAAENRAAVEELLARGGFVLRAERFLSPARDGFDGFYAAALDKQG